MTYNYAASPGHVDYTWTGLSNQKPVDPQHVYIPLQIQAYASQVKAAAAVAASNVRCLFTNNI